MPRKLNTLSVPGKVKSKKTGKIGFKGGLKKLEEKRNDIAVSEKKGSMTRGISKIGRTKKSIPVAGVKQKRVILSDPVLTKDEEVSIIDEESSELATGDSENEDMTRFCKRMCKKSVESMNESNADEIIKQKEFKKFQKTRDKFVSFVLTDFRAKVKANVKVGKFILYQYDTTTLHDQYTVQDLLHKVDDPSISDTNNQTGLRMIADQISPFQVIHYTHRVEQKPAKEYRMIEVTWAAPSKKNTKLSPNKLPEKYNRRWKISPVVQPILQATTITPEPPISRHIQTISTSGTSKNKNNGIISTSNNSKSLESRENHRIITTDDDSQSLISEDSL